MALLNTTLAYQLLAAARVTRAVHQGQALPAALAAEFAYAPSAAVRGAIQDLAYHAARQRAMCDVLMQQLQNKPNGSHEAAKKSAIKHMATGDSKKSSKNSSTSSSMLLTPITLQNALLTCALALLIDGTVYEPYTLVNQAVEAAKQTPQLQHAASMVNAVLRRFLREYQLVNDASKKIISNNTSTEKWVALQNQAALRYNLPDWWLTRLQQDYPQHWQAIAQQGTERPPMTLRVSGQTQARHLANQPIEKTLNHSAKTAAMPENGARAAFLTMLQAQGITASAHDTVASAVILAQPIAVSRIPGFAQGQVSVQDASAQYAAPLLDVHDGMRVLDACCAPGGKTGHLLELARIQLLALDNDAVRLQKVAENLKRLNQQAVLKVADVSQPKTWWNGVPFDRILLDVPCSGSGTVRRHPDLPFLRRRSDLPKLASVQAGLLDALWGTLAQGGKLLYSSCSIFKQENEHQVQAFLKRTTDAQRLLAPGQLLPDAQGDGHFLPYLKKLMRLMRLQHDQQNRKSLNYF